MLIGSGRWGASDPWLGIPVRWDQISGVRTIVESDLHDIQVSPSQGSPAAGWVGVPGPCRVSGPGTSFTHSRFP